MEYLTYFFTFFTLSYFWVTIMAVKNDIVDNRIMTPKEFWIWVAIMVTACMAVKFLT